MSDEFSVQSEGRGAGIQVPDLSVFYLFQLGQVFGPADLTTIATWIGEGRVTPRDWVFVPTVCDWQPILEIPEMAGCFYNVIDKPIGPPPGAPVELFLKYYKSQQNSGDDQAPVLVEKRQWVRIPLSASMTFWEVRDFDQEVTLKSEAYTLNISEGGLAFECGAALDEGKTIEVRVDFFPVTLHATARVVHSQPKGDSLHQIGVAFKNLAPSERDKIRHFIRSCLHTAARGAPNPQ